MQHHNISIGAGRNMDASWLQGRLDHLQRNAHHHQQQQQRSQNINDFCCASSMQDDGSMMQCEEEENFYRNNQNFNTSNYVTPRQLHSSLKRGRLEEEESGLQDRQRLKVMDFAAGRSFPSHPIRMDQSHTQTQLYSGFSSHGSGAAFHQDSYPMSMEM